MSDVMILAETVRDGEKCARKHGLDKRNVVTPRSVDRASARKFDDFVVMSGVRLDEAQWAALTPAFLHAGSEVLDRLFYEAQGKLPPPIELERETVLKF